MRVSNDVVPVCDVFGSTAISSGREPGGLSFRRSCVTRAALVLTFLAMLGSACASADSVPELSTDSSQPITMPEDPVPETVPPYDLPVGAAEPSWLIGVDYVGDTFIDRATGENLDAAGVTVNFSGRHSLSVAAAGCGVGSGSFRLVGGRIVDHQGHVLLMICRSTDQRTLDAARRLMQSDPVVVVDGARLRLHTDEFELALTASGPGLVLLAHDDERFVGESTTVEGIDPGRIQFVQDFFVAFR